MERQHTEAGLVELGTASTDTKGLPAAQELEFSGYKIKVPPG